MAILLRVGTLHENVLHLAARLLSHFGGLSGLARVSFTQLAQNLGMGESKVKANVKAALELARRLLATTPEERPVISCPRDVANLVMGEIAFLDQERLGVILVNTRN